MLNSNKIELLSPVGDFESLEAVCYYGADAVYLGSDIFGMRVSMRKSTRNFGGDKLEKAVQYAHERGIKVFLTCNTTPTNAEADLFPDFIKNAEEVGVDAAICADFGVMAAVKKYAPKLELHASTQVGITNYAAANALYEFGVKRVVLARELSLEDIAEIRRKTNPHLELECFVHGSMCMSYSGRCLISSYMTKRHANRGECSQPCRWKYKIIPEYDNKTDDYELYETETGESYILNAKDLCMIEYLPEIINAGVTSLKIEGRAKTAYYAGIVTSEYRYALDNPYAKNPSLEQLKYASHREFSTGFFFDENKFERQDIEHGGYSQSHLYVARVRKEYVKGSKYLEITQKNYFTNNDTLELILSKGVRVKLKEFKIIGSDGEYKDIANKAVEELTLEFSENYFADLDYIPESAIIVVTKNIIVY